MDQPNAQWRCTLLSEKLVVFWLEVHECHKTESYLPEFDRVWIERPES